MILISTLEHFEFYMNRHRSAFKIHTIELKWALLEESKHLGICNQIRQGLHRLEKYLNLEGFL